MTEIEFCPNCQSLLRKRKFDDGKTYLSCNCGYKKEWISPAKKKKKLTDEERKLKGMATKTVILDETNVVENPTTEVVCPKCGHPKAEYFQYQTRSADEPATTFYRCLKCNHKWREY